MPLTEDTVRTPFTPEDIDTVCLNMFDNRSFRRDVEYSLTDALAKRIESETPYKLQSDENQADSLMTGQILNIQESILTVERETGQALEKELIIEAVVSWKDLKTGELLLDNEPVTTTASYSEFLNQGEGYASAWRPTVWLNALWRRWKSRGKPPLNPRRRKTKTTWITSRIIHSNRKTTAPSRARSLPSVRDVAPGVTWASSC